MEKLVQKGITTSYEGRTWAYDVNTYSWERMDQGVGSTTTTPGTEPPVDMTWIYLAVGGIGVVIILVIIFAKRR